MKTEVVVENNLPDPEERRRIREQATLILNQARALRERLEQSEREFIWAATPNEPAVWWSGGYNSQVHLEHY